jgi:hypothetical protein
MEGWAMKQSLRYFVIVVLVALLIGLRVPAQAGWVAVDKNGDKSQISKGIVKNSNPRRDEWSLMDVNTGTLTVVNDQNKVYTTGTTKEFCETMTGMRNQMMSGGRGMSSMKGMPNMEKMMQGMEEAKKGMTPEQRQMMEQMMGRAKKRGGGMPSMGQEASRGPDPTVTVVKAGDGDVVAGLKTIHYQVSVDGRVAKEVWLTNDSALMKDIKPYMNKFLYMSREMSRCTSMRGNMMGGFVVESSEPYLKLMEKGYPLREKDIRSGWVREVKTMEQKSIPETELTLPKGYKPVTFMELMQSQMRGHRNR